MLLKIFFILILALTNASACCHCSIVSTSMKEITKAIKAGIKAGDETLSNSYNISILKKNQRILKIMELRLKELSNLKEVNVLGDKCDNRILFELNKANNMQSVDKSLEISKEHIEN